MYTYVDVESRTTADKVQSHWSKLTNKIEDILSRGEAVSLQGDFNRPLECPRPSMGTKLLREWVKEGKMRLLDDKIPTRIDPASGRGSILDLHMVSENIATCVKEYYVDSEKKMTPFSIKKDKEELKRRFTDHNAILTKIVLPMAQKKRAKKEPVINFQNPEGWERYKTFSDEFAPKMEEALVNCKDENALERELHCIDLDIQIKAFGITWRAPGQGKKAKRKEAKELEQIYKEQQEELNEMIEKGNIGRDVNQKIYNMRNLINGQKVQSEPTAINNPTTGELITDEGEIKSVSLGHNMKILKKEKPREQDKKEWEKHLKEHEEIMRKEDTDRWKVDKRDWKTVVDKIKENNKMVYKFFTKAGERYKESMFKVMCHLIEKETVPKAFKKTSLLQIWKKKGSALDLNNMRFIHLRSWRSKLMEALVTQKMKTNIVESTPKIQLGGMPGAQSSEHLLTLKTWMKMKQETGKNGVFQVFDMKKFFDKESLLDCMTSLSNKAKVDNKSYRLWFLMNEETRISVKTSVGDSEERNLLDSIGQGTAGAALVSSLNIGCAIEKIFKYEYTTRIGNLKLNSLVFQDDISKMNDNINQARIGCQKIDEILKKKLLSVNHDKSKYVLIGNSRFRKSIAKKIAKKPIKMGGVTIEQSVKEKYLGDIIHQNGCQESVKETVKERKRKLISKSEEIIKVADTAFMSGLGHAKTAFNLFEAQVIPALLNNAETWIGMANAQIKELQEFQDIFTRKVLRLAPSTTKAIINWDIKMCPMKWRIATKKLQFLRKIMLKENSNIAKGAVMEEVMHKVKGLAYECRKISREIGLDDPMIYRYSKKDIKEAIKDAMMKEFNEDMKNSVKVKDRLSDNPDDNSYINTMSLSKVRVWLRFRARATAGVKGNFRHSHTNNMGCRLCLRNHEETQEHLEHCEGTVYERRGLDLLQRRGLLDFWRRMAKRMEKIAAVTARDVNLKSGVVPSTHYISC